MMNNHSKQAALIAVALLFFGITASAQARQAAANYYFEPKISTLTGTLTVKAISNVARPYILVLSAPVNVIATKADEADGINVITRNIFKIQLTSSIIKLANYKYKKVRVSGTFFSASNIHHYTKVLLDVTKIEAVGNASPANQRIVNAVPPKPDAEKIKRDLIGYKISALPDSYLGKDWYWTIEEGEIKNIQIVSEIRQSDGYLFEVRLILQADGGIYQALVNLNYVLHKNNWTLDFMESKGINIVKTGKYDNCITTDVRGTILGGELDFTNHCSVALIIGGKMLTEFGGWKKFYTTVSANGTQYVGSWNIGSGDLNDWKIDFIERP